MNQIETTKISTYNGFGTYLGDNASVFENYKVFKDEKALFDDKLSVINELLSFAKKFNSH